MPCTNRGKCIGPDTCYCAPGTRYNGTTGVCDPLITCLPAPAVNPETGYIDNINKFSSADQTSCVRGTHDQLVALCQSSVCLDAQKCNADGSDKWDTVDENGTADENGTRCFKRANCAAVPCGAEYCGTGVTSVIGPISKVPSADNRSCFDPPKEDVALRCQDYNDGLNNTFLLYNSITDEYKCMSLQTFNNLSILEVQMLQGMGLTGSFCVSFPDAVSKETAKVTDGNGLFAYYSVLKSDGLSEAAGASVSEGFLNLKQLTSPSCNGYLYEFNATFSDMPGMAALPLSTPLSLRIDAYPVSRWTCKEQMNQVNVLKCTPAYTSGFQPVQLQPYAPEKGASVFLNPQMDPDAAAILIQNTTAWSTASSSLSPAVKENVKLEDLQPNQVLVNGAEHDKILQMACTEAYCQVADNLTAFKFMVLAWKFLDEVDPQSLGGTCAFLTGPLFVKYKLTRTSNTIGAPVELLTPFIQPNVFTLADKSRVALFIDAVPVDMTRTYTYTLSAYVVTSRDDVTTTYNTAPCRSAAEEVMSITVDPYNEKFCQQIRAPLADERQLPPFAWMQKDKGVCQWEINNLPAIDYYCGLYKQTSFDVNNFQLGDQKGECKMVTKSYPTILSNWQDSTCDPSRPYSTANYACVPVLPTLQHVLKYSDLKLQGGGTAAVNGRGTLDITLNTNAADGAVSVLLPQPQDPLPAYKYVVCNYVLTYLDQADAQITVVWQATNATLQLVADNITPASFVGLQNNDLNQPKQTVLLITNVPPNMQLNTDVVFSISLVGSSACRVEMQQMGFSNNVPTSTPGNACVPTAFGTMDYDTCFESCRKSGKLQSGRKQLGTPANCFDTTGKYDTRVCRGWSVKDDPNQMRQVQCDKNVKFYQGQGGLASEQNFKGRLRDMQAFYKQHHVGEPVNNADFDVDKLWQLYYNCGPSITAQYGFFDNDACDPDDDACNELSKVNGCASNNVCNEWTYVSGGVKVEDDFTPKWLQTRVCFPSNEATQGLSKCCDCRGTYLISDNHVPQCTCNEGESNCGDGLKL